MPELTLDHAVADFNSKKMTKNLGSGRGGLKDRRALGLFRPNLGLVSCKNVTKIIALYPGRCFQQENYGQIVIQAIFIYMKRSTLNKNFRLPVSLPFPISLFPCPF